MFNLFLGALLIIAGILFFFIEKDNYKKLTRDQYLQKTYFTDSFILVFVLIFIGACMLIREFYKLFV